MTYFDILTRTVYDSSLKILSPSDLNNLEERLEENARFSRRALDISEELERHAITVIDEEAVSPDFDEAVIRKALSLGLFTMSGMKRVVNLEEYNAYKHLVQPEDEGEDIYRYYLSIRHHNQKMIVDFDKLKYPKKTRRYVRQKFGDCTLEFNRDFDYCVKMLCTTYLDTWLCQPLVDVFTKIHYNPDSEVSVDTVELWNDDDLIAGELGFITKNCYTSLSGFHIEDNSGTIQMAALGEFLKRSGFAYWDLGMELEYKYAYGARLCDRAEQKQLFSKLSGDRLVLPTEGIKVSELIK